MEEYIGTRFLEGNVCQLSPKALDFCMPWDPEIPLLEISPKEITTDICKDLGNKMFIIDLEY